MPGGVRRMLTPVSHTMVSWWLQGGLASDCWDYGALMTNCNGEQNDISKQITIHIVKK